MDLPDYSSHLLNILHASSNQLLKTNTYAIPKHIHHYKSPQVVPFHLKPF